MSTPTHAYKAYLTARIQQHTLRVLNDVTDPPIFLNFATNDYLALSQHPDVLAQLQNKANGMGERSSRLIMAAQGAYLALESKIASCTRHNKALLFASGFQANATVLSALLDKHVLKKTPLVFCDRLIHASLHFACQKAGVKEIRYPHSDLNHLESLLKTYQNVAQPKFIVTESLFGMDGDFTHMANLIQLKEKYGAFLIVDEAHSIGCYGKEGYGLCSEFAQSVDVVTGSLSKALGCFGGFIACTETTWEFLVNHCPGLIYSNAPPLPLITAIDAAWNLLPQIQARRIDLHTISQYAHQALSDAGFNIGQTDSHLIPIYFGQSEKVMQLKAHLLKAGILVSAIRPPTVPPHQARVRLSLTAMHTKEDIDTLIRTIKSWGAA